DLLGEEPVVHLLGATGRSPRLCLDSDHGGSWDAFRGGEDESVSVLVLHNDLGVDGDFFAPLAQHAHLGSQGILTRWRFVKTLARYPSNVHSSGSTWRRREATCALSEYE